MYLAHFALKRQVQLNASLLRNVARSLRLSEDTPATGDRQGRSRNPPNLLQAEE